MEERAIQETGQDERPVEVYLRERRANPDAIEETPEFEIVSATTGTVFHSKGSEAAAIEFAGRHGWRVLARRSIEIPYVGERPVLPDHPEAAAILAGTLYRIRYEPIGDPEAPADEILTEIEQVAEVALRSVGIVPAPAGVDPLERFAADCRVCRSPLPGLHSGPRGVCGDCRVRVIDAMSEFGGSFVKSIAEAMRRADLLNDHRLREAFPEYWNEYLERVRREVAPKAVGS